MHEILKSLGRRVPLIKLQRIEERFSAVKEIMVSALCVCVCVCVCVCARARARGWVGARVRVCTCARARVHECACLNRRVLSFYFRYLSRQELNAVQEAFADFPFTFFQTAEDGHTYLKGLIDSVLYVLYH